MYQFGKGIVSNKNSLLSRKSLFQNAVRFNAGQRQRLRPGFGGFAEQPFLGLLAPAKSREGELFWTSGLEEHIFFGPKENMFLSKSLGTTNFFWGWWRNFTPCFSSRGFISSSQRNHRFFFKMVVDFQGFEFWHMWRKRIQNVRILKTSKQTRFD